MKAINKFSKIFTQEEIENVIKVKNEYFLVNKELQEFTANLNADSQNAVFPRAGILLGAVKKERFDPSLYFLELLAKKSTNKVFINNKAEWLFLCGRDAFKENAIKDNSTNNIFLVQNERDENIGLGTWEKKGKTAMLKNIMDRGDYLRREMSKK